MKTKSLFILLGLVAITNMASASFLPWEFNYNPRTAGGKKSTKGRFPFALQFDAGYTQIDYSEIHESQNFLDTIFTQSAIRVGGELKWMLIPEYIGVGVSGETIIPGSSSVEQKSSLEVGDTCCEITTTDTKAWLKFYVPGTEPFNLTLVSEYFYSKIETTSSQYGHTPAQGSQYGAQLDLTSPGGSVIFLRWYPWKTLGDREEFNGGIHLKLSGKGAAYPFSIFNSGFLLKFDYKIITLFFEGTRSVEVNRREATASLSFRF